MQKPPCHKCPCCAVPQPAAQKNNHRVHTGARQPPAAATQRDIQVIPEKAGQADVPVAPELRHGLREERTAEIFHQFHAQNARRAPGDVGVGGKIAVKLKAEQHRGRRRGPAAQSAALGIDGVRQQRQPVRHNHFLNITPQHQHKAAFGPLVGKTGRQLQLGQDIAAAFNGPGHQLRKKGDKQQIPPKALLGGHAAPVYVHSVTDRLKRVEADADRQEHTQQRYGGEAPRSQQTVRTLRKKIIIFEEKQNSQICRQRNGHGRPAPAPVPGGRRTQYRQHTPAQIGAERGKQDEHNIGRIPAHIEKAAARKQPWLPRAARQHIINKNRRNEKRTKAQRNEVQSRNPPLFTIPRHHRAFYGAAAADSPSGFAGGRRCAGGLPSE